MRNLIRTISLLIAIAACSTLLLAEDGILVLSVTNTAEAPVDGVTLKCKGDAPPGWSDRNGTARLKLPFGAQPGHSVVLQVTIGDWALISPWDGHVVVPFANSPQNFVTVVVARKGDKQMLASGKALEAIASRVLKDAGSKLDKQQLSEQERRLALETQAREVGLTPEEVDRAIREWGRKVTDRQQKGLVELYNKNFPEAEKLLNASLEEEIREIKDKQNKAANTAFFLGQARFEQGRYRDAAKAFEIALSQRPGDGVILNSLSVSYSLAGDLREAERYGARAVPAKGEDPRFGLNHPATGIAAVNLALVYQKQGNYADAGRLFKQAVEIAERGYGPDDPQVADCLDFYADLLLMMERKAEAEEKRVRARAIRANYEQQMREKAIADSKQLLKLKEEQLGPEHVEVASVAGSLGSLYQRNGQPAEAEALFKRALGIREKMSGRDHLDTAGDLQRLSSLYEEQSRYAEAEPLLKRALAILEKEFGQNNPFRLLPALENYARLLQKMGRRNEAAVAETKAKVIREKIGSFRGVDPSQVMPAGVNASGVSSPNVTIDGRPGIPPPPPLPPVPSESKKPAKSKPKPKKRSK